MQHPLAWIAGALTLLLCGLTVSEDAPSKTRAFSPEMQKSLQEVFEELHALEAKLRPIRKRAESDETLIDIEREIETDVLAAVKSLFADKGDAVDRLRELRSKPKGEADGEAPGEARAEMNRLRGELEPMISEVRALPEFRLRILSYENLVEATMREIAPEAEALLARRNALHLKFFRLQREAMEAVRKE